MSAPMRDARTSGDKMPVHLSIKLVLPMPPNIANGAHGHYYARHREKLAYWRLLDGLYATGGWGISSHWKAEIPHPPFEPFAKASIRSTMYLGGAMDDSNAMRRHKWVEDWLKTRRYIKDDRKKCLKWEGFPTQIVKRDGNYRIEITLDNLAKV